MQPSSRSLSYYTHAFGVSEEAGCQAWKRPPRLRAASYQGCREENRRIHQANNLGWQDVVAGTILVAVSRIAAGKADDNYLAGSYRQSCERMVLTKMRRRLLSERRLRLCARPRHPSASVNQRPWETRTTRALVEVASPTIEGPSRVDRGRAQH